MKNKYRRVRLIVALTAAAVLMVMVYALPVSAASKKVYKVPYKVIQTDDSNYQCTVTAAISKGKMTSATEVNPELTTKVKLAYKSSKKVVLSSNNSDMKVTLRLKKNKAVKATAGNYTSVFQYGKKGRLCKIVSDDVYDDATYHSTVTYKLNKKGDFTKRVSKGVETPADGGEPNVYTSTYKFVNTYKGGLLKTQKGTEIDSGYSITRKIRYKRVKMTKAQYTRYMSMWDLFEKEL